MRRIEVKAPDAAPQAKRAVMERGSDFGRKVDWRMSWATRYWDLLDLVFQNVIWLNLR